MDSLSSVTPSIVLPPSNPLPTQRHRPLVAVFSFATNNRLPCLSSFFSVPSSKGRLSRVVDCKCKLNGRDAREEDRDDDDVDGEKEEVERALIWTAEPFILLNCKSIAWNVCSDNYLVADEKCGWVDPLVSSEWTVFEIIPFYSPYCSCNSNWNRKVRAPTILLSSQFPEFLKLKGSLDYCFLKEQSGVLELETKLNSLNLELRFRCWWRMLGKEPLLISGCKVEDLQLVTQVFEDENEAAKYWELMQGGGQGCEGVAEIEASSVFDLCHKMRALAVLFRRGRTPPLPQKSRAQPESPTSLILWHAHQNDTGAVRKLLVEDRCLVHARDYDNRTPLHVASLHSWIDVAKCLLDYGADVNAQDRWNNTPLADAEGAKKHNMIELLKSYGGLSYGQNGSHFEPKPVPPPLPNKCDWEIDPSELDFSNSNIIGKQFSMQVPGLFSLYCLEYVFSLIISHTASGSFGEILKASWRGTPVAIKRILPSLSDDRLVIQDFRHEVNLLVKLHYSNIVQFLGAVTEKKPLMLITEYLRGGDLHQYLKEKSALHLSKAINFALDIASGMAYLHNEPNVIIHRDLKPRNVLLVNSSADHLKVGGFGLSKLIKVQHSHDVYKMTGETGSCESLIDFLWIKYDPQILSLLGIGIDRYMAPEVFKHRKYDKKMLEGEPPFSNYEPYEAAKYVAEGHQPTFRSKSYLPELRDLTDKCWAADMNRRPSFLDILKRLEKIQGKHTHGSSLE
ncbi:hypothetical protein CRYUN_Cryun21dG0014400 [Craigia yunnanensis]